MKKIVSILFSIALSVGAVYAQQEADYKDDYIKRLQDDIKNRDRKIDSLENKVIKALIDDTTRLGKKMRTAQKDAGKYSKKKQEAERKCEEFKHKCDSLQKQQNQHPAWDMVKRLQADSLKLTTSLAEAKTTSDSIFKEANEKNKTIIAKKDSVIKSLQNELAQMKDFKVQFIASLAKQVDDKWLKASFEELLPRQNELKEDLKLYETFKSEKAVTQAYDSLMVLDQDLHVYIDAQKILNEGTYNFNTVEKLKVKIAEIIKEPTNKKQAEEINQLNELLCIYTDAVETFKYIIDDVKEDLSGDIELIKIRLEDNFISEIEYLQRIPWLKKMYDNYIKEIEKDTSNTNPQKPRTVAEKIYNLKTK